MDALTTTDLLPVRLVTFDSIAERMLPMARLQAERAAIAARYRAAQPYPHVVLDGFFDEEVLDRVERSFPRPGDRDWLAYDTANEVKQTSRGILGLDPFTQLFLWQMCSAPFMAWLRAVTGVVDLCVDSTFHGGGLHESRRGGWLNLHADWTQHPHLPLVRQLNMIVYLNRDWQEEWGGALELHGGTQGGGPVARVAPLFNRAVIFPTTSETLHGFPNPMTCPPDRARRSVSWFYWSPDEAAIERGAPISFLPGTRGTRAHALLRSCVPPIAFQLRDRLRRR
jgi:2OG-Fe(II) oxygenase superfamily